MQCLPTIFAGNRPVGYLLSLWFLMTYSLSAQDDFKIIPPAGQPFEYLGCVFDKSAIEESQQPTFSGGTCQGTLINVTVDSTVHENQICKLYLVKYVYTDMCDGDTLGSIIVEHIVNDNEEPLETICDDEVLYLDDNCASSLEISFNARDNRNCELKWHSVIDAFADGDEDYILSSYAMDPASGDTMFNWTTNPELSQEFGLPTDVLWKFLPPSQPGMTPQLETIPVDLAGGPSRHRITKKVTDDCHNFSACTYILEVVDTIRPVVQFLDSITVYSGGSSSSFMQVKFTAIDVENGSYDNCTPSEDLLYTFDGINCVQDTLIRIGNTFKPVNRTVPHFFDKHGFVDWDGDGIDYPKVKTSTIARYNNGDIQRWDPSRRTSTLYNEGIFCTYPGSPPILYFTPDYTSVWDAYNNEGRTSRLKFLPIYLSGGVGRISNQFDLALPSAIITVYDSLGQALVETHTSISGRYSIDGELDQDYIQASFPKRPPAELSTRDVARLMQGIEAGFTNPYLTLAADVNMDGYNDMDDALEMYELILGKRSHYSAAPSHIMIKKGADLSAGFQAGMDTAKLSIITTNTVDFVGVRMGELDSSYNESLYDPVCEDTITVTLNAGRKGRTTIYTYDRYLEAGEEFEVDVWRYNAKESYGMQLNFRSEGLSFLDIEGDDIALEDYHVAMDEDQLRISYADFDASTKGLFTIRLRAEVAGQLSEMLRITNEPSFRNEEYVNDTLQINDVSFEVVDDITGYQLFQNSPNPFLDFTRVEWEQAEGGLVTFNLYDMNGVKVRTWHREYQEGRHVYNLARRSHYTQYGLSQKELFLEGVYFYEISVNGFRDIKKMIHIL